MAHLWAFNENNRWAPIVLNSDAFDLRTISPLDGFLPECAGKNQPLQALIRVREGAWAVVAGCAGDIYLNGRPIVTGIALLADRDEILLRSKRPLFFSTETLASVQELPAAETTVFCGRCRQPMKNGTPAVRCPVCGVWYDQTISLPCWTYSDKCAFCGRETALDAGFSWTPEE